MFVSFFPRPKWFFWSALAWTAFAMALWYGYARGLVEIPAQEIVGVSRFWSASHLWFDLYFALRLDKIKEPVKALPLELIKLLRQMQKVLDVGITLLPARLRFQPIIIMSFCEDLFQA